MKLSAIEWIYFSIITVRLPRDYLPILTYYLPYCVF